MKPEIKQRWVEALRSGDYKQGRGYLLQSGEYCCLGVLCDLAGKDGVGRFVPSVYPVSSDVLNFVPADGAVGSATTLPVAVQRWAGLRGNVPDVTDFDGHLVGLTDLNDGQEAPFDKIADLIEGQL
jgi:hypothetical protein